MRSFPRFVLLMALLSLSGVPGAFASADVETIKDGALDEIHLKVKDLPKNVPVVIVPFSTEGVDLGTGGDDAKNEKRSDATKAMVKIGPDMLAEAFRKALAEGGALRSATEEEAKGGGEVLLVEGTFLKIDPGSRAKRYFAGFGAGKSGVQVTGTIKDRSGAVLAEFTHMKHSAIGVGGGDYVKFLSDDTRDVGRGIAKFLSLWATGGNLKKD